MIKAEPLQRWAVLGLLIGSLQAMTRKTLFLDGKLASSGKIRGKAHLFRLIQLGRHCLVLHPDVQAPPP